MFLDGIELPRGLDREVVLDGDERYELNGDDSRTLAAVGAFRVAAERDLQSRLDESGDARDPGLDAASTTRQCESAGGSRGTEVRLKPDAT